MRDQVLRAGQGRRVRICGRRTSRISPAVPLGVTAAVYGARLTVEGDEVAPPGMLRLRIRLVRCARWIHGDSAGPPSLRTSVRGLD